MSDSRKKYLVLINTLIRGEVLRAGVEYPSLEAKKFGATLSDFEYLVSVGHAEVIKSKDEIQLEKDLIQADKDGETNFKAPSTFPTKSFTAMQIENTKYNKEQEQIKIDQAKILEEIKDIEARKSEKGIGAEDVKKDLEEGKKNVMVKKPKASEKNKNKKNKKKSTSKKIEK